MPYLLYISYLLILQLVSWISEVLQWLRFAKKLFSSRSPPPVSCTNALQPDSPARKFREQQIYSESSESAEGTEDSEDSDNSEITAFPVACRPWILSACLEVNPIRTLVICSRSTPDLTNISTELGITPSAGSGQSYSIFSLVYTGQGNHDECFPRHGYPRLARLRQSVKCSGNPEFGKKSEAANRKMPEDAQVPLYSVSPPGT